MKSIFYLMLLLLILTGCAGGRSAFSKAEKLEREGNLDEALVKYAEVTTANPDIGEYRLKFLKVCEAAAISHYKKGEKFLADKNYDEALREFQTSYGMDPSHDIARQQSEKVLKLRNSVLLYQEGEEFEKNRKPREALNSFQKALDADPNNTGAKEALERLIKSKRPKLEGYELNLKSTKPITLKFKDAKIKEIFAIISQLSGINFIFDEGMKDQNVSIYLENATFQQALEIICGINKLSKKVLNESTIIIYAKSPEKAKQYEELFVQTFYLNKLDAKKAVNLIRTMLQVKKIYVNEEMNTLVLRDTREVIDVAQKILEANDVPDAEVLLEVEVIELSKKNTESFGLALSRYGISANVLTPSQQFFSDTFNPTTATTTTTTGTTATVTTANPANLLNAFNIKGYGGYVTVPNATFNFGKSLANGETLSNPKIRVKNREKAKFNVGTRVPITTTSSPTGGGVSVNVQYVDVGVKVNAEPTIQLNNDVAIKLGLEVSSILQKEAVGSDKATTVVTIGTRNLDTVLSLKDGETSIIGGLIQDIKSDNKDKIFLLGDIPFIGALFSNQNKSNDKTELLLAITPRIIRGITVPDNEVSAFWSGREDDPSISKPYSSFTQESEIMPVAQASSPAQTTSSPAVTSPTRSVPPAETAVSGKSSTEAPVAAPKTIPPAAVSAPVSSVETPATKTASKIALNIVAPSTVTVNEQFVVMVNAEGVKNLFSSPFTLVFDPKVLEFVNAAEGGLLKTKGAATNFLYKIDRQAGQVTVIMTRFGDSGGAEGGGTLASFTFRAINKGEANLGFANVSFVDPGGKALAAVPFNTVVEVK
jgi:general secretion pathway protein D